MKFKSILLLFVICAGTLFAAEKVLELTPGKFHYYGSKANIAKIKQSVKMSGGGGANPLVINYDTANLPGYNEIRYGFSKPFNAGKDTVLEFDFEVSRPTKFMLLFIRSKNHKMATFWFSTLCGGGWRSALIPNRRIKGRLKNFAKLCNPEEITQIAFAFLPNPKEDREKLEVDKKPLTVKIYPLRFVPVKSNTAPDLKKKQQEYNKKITSYKADLRPFAPLKQVRKGGFFLVKDGKAQAEIVLPAKSDAVMDFAAKELTLWIKNITGAELPKSFGKPSGRMKHHIFFGKSFAGKKYAADVKKLGDSFGFAIRRSGNDIFLLGDVSKGVLNSVYWLLYNNSDIIFTRPDPKIGTVYSKSKDFYAGKVNTLKIPSIKYGGWGTNWGFNYNDELWSTRNYSAYTSGGGGWAPGVKQRVPWGNLIRFGGGHNLYYMMSLGYQKDGFKKLFAAHPEYFALINGKRQFPKQMENNPCFTNMASADLAAKNIIEKLGTSEIKPESIGFSVEDNWGLCQCENCLKPIILKDGTKVDYNDPAFRSTQTFIWLTRIGSQINKKYPKLGMNVLAYFFTAEPPKFVLPDYMSIRLCPYIRPNDKQPIYGEDNIIWYDRIMKWLKVCPKGVTLREYYGVGTEYPRTLSQAAQAEIQEYTRLGINMVTSEINPDAVKRGRKLYQVWDITMIEYWMITQLYFDCFQDIEALRREFVQRTFREAAMPMQRFYAAFREEWFKNKRRSNCGDSALNSLIVYLRNTGREKEMIGYLDEAEKLAKHPVSLALIKRIKALFNKWIQEADNMKIPEVSVPLIEGISKAGFDSPLWKNAGVINQLAVYDKPQVKSRYTTNIFLAHDAKNLVVLCRCDDPKPEKLFGIPQDKAKEIWPRGDHMEYFFSDPKRQDRFVQFAINCNNTALDRDNIVSEKWNSKWQHKVRKTKKGYEVITVFPLSDLNVNLGTRTPLRGLFFRTVSHNGDRKDSELSTWGGGKAGQQSQFGIIRLMR